MPPQLVLLLLLIFLVVSITSAWLAPPQPFSTAVHRPSSQLYAEKSAKASSGSGGGRKRSSSTSKSSSSSSSSSSTSAPKGLAVRRKKTTAAGKEQTKRIALGDELAFPDAKDLPDLGLLPPLSPSQLLEFERRGHVVTRGICSPSEITAYSQVLLASFNQNKLEAYRQKVRVLIGNEAYADCRTIQDCLDLLDEVDSEYIPFLQTFNSWRQFQDVRKFALAKRFGHIAAQLLGVKRVRLYQDSLFYKRTGDGATGWHSDCNMIPLDTNEVVTMWMPLTEIPPEEEGGSGLTYADGSHRDFALNYWSDPHAKEDLSGRYTVSSHGRMSPGDASWHHGWTLHSAGGNLLPEARAAFTLAFLGADNARVLSTATPHYPDPEDDLSYADWIHDQKPGERLRDHPLIPIVYDEGTGM